jgi:hypothetical protein
MPYPLHKFFICEQWLCPAILSEKGIDILFLSICESSPVQLIFHCNNWPLFFYAGQLETGTDCLSLVFKVETGTDCLSLVFKVETGTDCLSLVFKVETGTDCLSLVQNREQKFVQRCETKVGADACKASYVWISDCTPGLHHRICYDWAVYTTVLRPLPGLSYIPKA